MYAELNHSMFPDDTYTYLEKELRGQCVLCNCKIVYYQSDIINDEYYNVIFVSNVCISCYNENIVYRVGWRMYYIFNMIVDNYLRCVNLLINKYFIKDVSELIFSYL